MAVPGIAIPITEQRLDKVTAVISGGLPAVDVGGEGHAIRVDWTPAPGANRAEVTSGSLLVGVANVQQSLGDLAVTKAGNSYDVTIPGGSRIASLTLFGLKVGGSAEITSSSSLPRTPDQHRLVVRARDGGQVSAPLHSMPSVDARNMIPASLTGAGFTNRVLTLPDLKAERVRLSVVRGRFPEEFSEQPFTLNRVSGVASVFPVDTMLLGPDGAVLWAFPGELPPGSQPFPVDLRVPAAGALNSALQAGQPPDVTFRLAGTGSAGLTVEPVHGALVRDLPGVTTVTLEGDPATLPIPGAQLSSEQPASATCDLTVTYAGIRILDELSDPLPAQPLTGFIVGEAPVVRGFPPRAFAGLSPARIGLIGRAPVECELVVHLVEMAGNLPGPVIGAPLVRTIAPANEAVTHWFTIPAGLDLAEKHAGIAVRTNRGRFFWAGEGTPLVRVAVHDPEPAGRSLLLDGQPVLPVTATEAHHPACSLPVQPFRSRPPVLHSSLFLAVDVSDLALRYAR